LPSYNLDNNQVKVKIIGKVVDINYARKLAQSKSELTVTDGRFDDSPFIVCLAK
jgi:hypothetical protein